MNHVDADLTKIAAGGAATRSRADPRIAVYVNGLGIEDLAAAIELYQLACALDAGIVLPPQGA